MHLSNGYTYMLSISQFLNSLAEVVKIDLLCLDSKQQFADYLHNRLNLELHPNLNIVQIKNTKFGIKSNKLFFKAGVAKYLKTLNNNERKIIYTRDLKQMIAALKLKNTLKNTKFIFETHQILSQNLCKDGEYQKAKKIRKLENFVFNNVDSLICITKTLSSEIKKTFPQSNKNHFILPLGFNKKFLEVNNNKIYDIIYSGNFSNWKGLDTLIESLSIIKNKYGKELKVVLIGADKRSQPVYQEQVNNLGLSIKIIPRIHHKEIYKYVSLSKVGVLPNNYSGDSLLFTSPLKLYEYLGSGLKVVVSRLPSIESAVDESLVYFAQPENPKSFAKQILKALDDKSFNQDHVQNFAKNYTWEMRAKKLINFLS
jgi:glycosyltransferase involved in cell wall biosynthesis